MDEFTLCSQLSKDQWRKVYRTLRRHLFWSEFVRIFTRTLGVLVITVLAISNWSDLLDLVKDSLLLQVVLIFFLFGDGVWMLCTVWRSIRDAASTWRATILVLSAEVSARIAEKYEDERDLVESGGRKNNLVLDVSNSQLIGRDGTLTDHGRMLGSQSIHARRRLRRQVHVGSFVVLLGTADGYFLSRLRKVATPSS